VPGERKGGDTANRRKKKKIEWKKKTTEYEEREKIERGAEEPVSLPPIIGKGKRKPLHVWA